MNGMRVDSMLQASRFLYSCAFGLAAYLLYRGQTWFQRRGRARRGHVLRGLLLDAGYWLVTLAAFVLLVLGLFGGELRLYHLFGVGSGAAVGGLLTMRRYKEKA